MMEASKCLLLSAILALGYPWVLKSTHINVIRNLTDDVILRCFWKNNHDIKTILEKITRIRLLKLDGTDTWSTYAEVVVPNRFRVELTDPNVPGVHASGRLGELNQTYLSVTWPTASYDTLGTYKCEVDGFAFHLGTNTQINTAMVNITNDAVTVSDLLSVAIQMKRKADSMSEELESLKEAMPVQRQEISSNIMSKVQSKIEDNFFESRYWPTDSYTLLSSSEGCPDTLFSKMINGYVRIETDSHTPNHSISLPNHFHLDVIEKCGSRHVLHFRFCENPNHQVREIHWPKGSYCIHRNQVCPKDFLAGYVELYLTSSSKLRATEKNIGNTCNWISDQNVIYLHFCCRSDGDVEDSIILPNQKPFYLYRYKGKCQKVLNTNVTEEWLFLDTDDAKTDAYHQAAYADSELNDARFHLCYYKHS